MYSISSDVFKVTKITPIQKSGDLSEPGNFRSISKLPTLSDIFEQLLYDRKNI